MKGKGNWLFQGLSTPPPPPPPPRLQILRIDGEGMINDVITHAERDVFVRREIDVVGIATFDLIGLLPTNHITAYITMAYQSL